VGRLGGVARPDNFLAVGAGRSPPWSRRLCYRPIYYYYY